MTRELIIKTAPLTTKPSGTVVVYAADGSTLDGAARTEWMATGLDYVIVANDAGFKGKQGQVLDIVGPSRRSGARLLVLGRGKPSDSEAVPTNAWTDRGGSLAGKLIGLKVRNASVLLDEPGASPQKIADLAAGMRLRHYRFDRYKAVKDDEKSDPQTLTVTLFVRDPEAADRAIADRLATASGTLLARDLVNEPANVLGTLEFAERASRLAELGVGIEILDEPAMRALGMNALLCVAQGSPRPPRLVIMSWNGGDPGEARLAFVGKGVVFDTGGISIKGAAGMEDMKGDMGGAAAVTGLMHALATRKARVNAVGVIGIVENSVDGNSVRPGDIVRAMNGTTIEVNNTDAEGRLVLADALWYTQDRFKPKFMVNLATLTGAILVALGQDHAGLFSNDDELSNKLVAAGLASGEKLWRLPMGPAYEKMIESRFADIKNSAGRHAGSITAAHFLHHFVNNVPWAHLDIAGAGMGTNANEINTSWAPGFGVALLDRLIRDNYEGAAS
jgi:leucyl aminopeptidase